MKPISALLYECTTEEAQSLPKGFQVLEYDTLYGSLRLLTAGENKIRSDKRYVYLLHKEPPAEFIGSSGKGSSRLMRATRRAAAAASEVNA